MPGQPDDAAVLGYLFDSVFGDQYDLNRRAARRAAGLADALDFARTHHSIFALVGDSHPEVTAERCAVLEASCRLAMSEMTVRSLAYTADAARTHLPLLWHRAAEGFATLAQVDSAVEHLSRFDARPEALAAFDDLLADAVLNATPSKFRAVARRAAKRLAPRPEAEDHVEAAAKRRVWSTREADGVSLICALVPTVEAQAIMSSLRVTAKHRTKAFGDKRTRDQLRADIFVERLTGAGTAGAVKTKIFVTVPLDRLSEEARATVRTDAGSHPGLDLNEYPLLVGEDTVDDVTARKLLLDAGEFTRVITDPVSGVILDMDRRSRKVTRAQREWLMLSHSTCIRDGCSRPAMDAEIDHWCEFHGPGRGSTDIDNLGPLCEPDHRLKGTTGVAFKRRDDGSTALAFPSGYETYQPSEWSLRIKAMVAALRVPREIPDDPPF